MDRVVSADQTARIDEGYEEVRVDQADRMNLALVQLNLLFGNGKSLQERLPKDWMPRASGLPTFAGQGTSTFNSSRFPNQAMFPSTSSPQTR